MTTIVWLGLSALASAGLMFALVRKFSRKVPAPVAAKITSTP